jgi:hypothetical protein
MLYEDLLLQVQYIGIWIVSTVYKCTQSGTKNAPVGNSNSYQTTCFEPVMCRLSLDSELSSHLTQIAPLPKSLSHASGARDLHRQTPLSHRLRGGKGPGDRGVRKLNYPDTGLSSYLGVVINASCVQIISSCARFRLAFTVQKILDMWAIDTIHRIRTGKSHQQRY